MMLRWTEEQLREHIAGSQSRMAAKAEAKAHQADKPRAKYRNKRTEISGEKFDSKAEGARFVQLRRMQEAGIISNLRRQVPFELAPAVKIPGKHRMSPPLRYFADFVYEQDGKTIIEDVKGQEKVTEGYRIKRHLMALLGHQIIEVRKTRTRKSNPV